MVKQVKRCALFGHLPPAYNESVNKTALCQTKEEDDGDRKTGSRSQERRSRTSLEKVATVGKYSLDHH
ncbi:hypothetical protein [Cohnella zeiphila]|uniref:Uncharacterized protein n=1 Tax=Cohnella zeiphila TaxID=2761120 RepID=A0A7X0VUF8_9BACL|nr:hypothetical protein [Cohnella zeiphila]MBB6730896.1 hypothetical protein [Cohnella zeiphila]